jgi:signal transduction histidine kinase/CHASE3 domain sensor protein
MKLFKRILLGFLVALVLIVGLGFLNFISSSRLSEAHELLEGSKDRVILLHKSASLIKDIQRAHRGFVLTKDKRFLDPYYHSLEDYPELKAAIVTANWAPSQRKNINAAVRLANRKFELTEQALFAPDVMPRDSVLYQIRLGKELVDSLNLILASVEAHELHNQSIVEEKVHGWLSANQTVIISGVIAFIAVVAGGLYHLYRIMRERYRLYKELQSRNKEAQESNEELQLLNEELNSSNEHLQHAITALEQTQNELMIRQAELNDAQSLSGTGSFRFDLKSGKLSYSSSYAKILELPPGTEFNNYEEFLRLVHPSDRHLLEGNNPADTRGSFHTEFRILVNNRVKHIRAKGETIESDSGSYILGAITDVTEIEQAHQQVAQANAKLVRSNADLDAFTYSISHDLKAPVRSIMMYSNLLKEKFPDENQSEEAKWVNVVLKKSRQMAEMIEGLLALSRYGHLSLSKSNVDMDVLVREILEEMSSSYPAAKTDIRTRLGTIEADPSLIRQVWINLLSNAFKFSEQVSQPLIDISARQNGNSTEYIIQDNGAGFESEKISDLFHVFKRLHSPQEFTGSGVGLAIVRRIIDAHGGEITASSNKGQGAIFRFTLPHGSR